MALPRGETMGKFTYSLDRRSDLIKAGVRAADSRICEEDKIWSRYSHDKIDIGEEVAKVIRTLSKAMPLDNALRALSIGSSNEPQFRILETTFRGGLYLIDVDGNALDIVQERIHRQYADHVATIHGDYNKIFLSLKNTELFLKNKLGGKKVNLITLHHSLYYSHESDWMAVFKDLFKEILAPKGAIHAVLMASRSDDPHTTTWLYNHFIGKFFGCRNDQDLKEFELELRREPLFKNAQILLKTNKVRFYVDDFAKFMKVVWMILLYPNVHRYNSKQKEEITEFIYRKFWKKKEPLIQVQDHLVIYKGIGLKGLI